MPKIYRKLAHYGGEGGSKWDDDVYEGVRKVYVGQDLSRITYIKFEYVKEDGKVVTSEYGTKDQHPKEFVVEYPNEHIIGVEGSYKQVSLLATEVITSLVFKTSKGRKSPTFGPNLLGIVSGTKFDFEDGGKKIVGFHGRSGAALDALGVYFEHGSLTTPSPLYKLDAQGGPEGRVWDDGAYDGVKTLRICRDDCRITYLEIEYEKGGKLETRHHGVKAGTPSEFVLDYPNEYIKSVEATYHKPNIFRNAVITSLSFKTSKERTSSFGYNNVGNKFLLEQKGLKIVGFHGREGDAIDALGAYFAPVSTPTPLIPPKKLQAKGGNGGVTWDDGVYDNVRKILVGQGNDGVSFVKFEYIKGTDLLSGADHGKKTLLDPEEFVLEHGEYLTALEGYYDKVYGVEAPMIISLKFKTNKRESILFGMNSGEKFSIGENGHKIVGFHGQASDVVHSIGVTVVPITTTK